MDKNEIWSIIDEYRMSGQSIDDTSALISFLQQKEMLSYEDIEFILTKTSHHGIEGAPILVSAFIAAFAKHSKAKTFLDPFAANGQVVYRVTLESPASVEAISLSANDYAMLQYISGNITSKLGNFLDIEMDKQYDLIGTNLPFSANIGNVKNYGMRVVEKSATLINEDGFVIGTFPSSIAFSFKAARELLTLEANSLFVHAMIDLPARTYAPRTNISSKIVIWGRAKPERRFIAKLSSVDEIDSMLEGFFLKRNKRPASLGQLVDAAEYQDYHAFARAQKIKKIEKDFAGTPYPIHSVAKKVTLIKRAEDDAPNSIFIPRTGNSDVVTSLEPSEESQNKYFQVVLDESKVINIYAAFFLNSPAGRYIRDAYKRGSETPFYTKQDVEQLIICVPTQSTQQQMAKTELSIRKLEQEAKQLREAFEMRPSTYRQINKQLKMINHEDTLERWAGSLPLPMATSLLRALAEKDPEKQQKRYLHFFEATTQYFAVVFLSVLWNVRDRVRLPEIFKSIDLDRLKTASFGSWVVINTVAAKFFRTQLSSPDDKEFVLSCFATDDDVVVNKLCDKEMHKLLEKISIQRNEWEGHAGATSTSVFVAHNQEFQKSILTLKGILGDSLEEMRLIHPISWRKRSRKYYIDAKVLMGANAILPTKEISTFSEAPDESYLYLFVSNTERVIELLPLLQCDSNTDRQSVCMFFSRIIGDKATFKSYHDDESEIVIEALDIQTVLNGLRNDERN